MRPEMLAETLATTIRGLVSPLALRVAALEQRVPEPGPMGPPGPPGPAGRDGLDGKDGAPGLRYLGVHVREKTYDVGDVVTYDGSAWYCANTTTNLPGDSSRDWQLMVKHGRDLRRGDRP